VFGESHAETPSESSQNTSDKMAAPPDHSSVVPDVTGNDVSSKSDDVDQSSSQRKSVDESNEAPPAQPPVKPKRKSKVKRLTSKGDTESANNAEVKATPLPYASTAIPLPDTNMPHRVVEQPPPLVEDTVCHPEGAVLADDTETVEELVAERSEVKENALEGRRGSGLSSANSTESTTSSGDRQQQVLFCSTYSDDVITTCVPDYYFITVSSMCVVV